MHLIYIAQLIMLDKIILWVKKNPFWIVAILVSAYLVWKISVFQKQIIFLDNSEFRSESFEACFESKQVYINSCDESAPTSHAVVDLQRQSGKIHFSINANLPYASGGLFHTVDGKYKAFLASDNEEVEIGTLVRHGDRWYKLATELEGDFSKFKKLHVYLQTEDYPLKRVLSGTL